MILDTAEHGEPCLPMDPCQPPLSIVPRGRRKILFCASIPRTLLSLVQYCVVDRLGSIYETLFRATRPTKTSVCLSVLSPRLRAPRLLRVSSHGGNASVLRTSKEQFDRRPTRRPMPNLYPSGCQTYHFCKRPAAAYF